MESKKREIKRKPPVQTKASENKTTDTNVVVDSGKSVLKHNTESTKRKGKTSLQDKRFILVQIQCELFEYSDLIKIDFILNTLYN